MLGESPTIDVVPHMMPEKTPGTSQHRQRLNSSVDTDKVFSDILLSVVVP